MERITSGSNRWVKQIGKLQRKKYRDQTGLFVIEGVRIVTDALLAGIRDGICLIGADRLQDPRADLLIQTGLSLGWLFCEIDTNVYKTVSCTEHGQGIIAIVPKPLMKNKALSMETDGWAVFLDALQDPGNLGTVIRTAAASGSAAVLLGKGCADPYSEKAVRSSMGSLFRVPVYQNVDISYLKDRKQDPSIMLVATALEGGKDYRTVPLGKQGIFVFGNEGNGISPAIRALCDQTVYIPLQRGVESLNVSVAASVILFHYLR